MRILFVSPYMEAASGVQTFVRTLSSFLDRHGAQPRVLDQVAGRGPSGLRNALLAWQTARIVWRDRDAFDVLHAQQLHPQSLVAGVVARVLGKGVVITIHGRSPPPKGLRRAVFTLVERWTIRVPHAVVFVARSLRDKFDRGTVVPNGVDVAAMVSDSPNREEVRAEFGLSAPFVLVFVGRVTRDKGVTVLLDALLEVRRRAPDRTALVAVGPVSDEVRRDLEERPDLLVSRMVILAGERSDVPRVLSAGDAFVLPSFHEGLPYGLLEAMASGLPVISSRVGDVADLVRPGKTGWLVPPGSVSELADAILSAAMDLDRCRAMGTRGSALIASSFSVEAMGERYLKIYRTVLQPQS